MKQEISVAAPARILIVDDNPVDVQVIRFALQEETDWPSETTVAVDGQEAIDYLLDKVARGVLDRPDLIILDLNLPKRDGTEVLQTIQSTTSLASIPVLIFSCYSEEVIRKKVQDANVTAACYLTKPSAIEEFSALGSKLRQCCAKQKIQQSFHADLRIENCSFKH